MMHFQTKHASPQIPKVWVETRHVNHVWYSLVDPIAPGLLPSHCGKTSEPTWSSWETTNFGQGKFGKSNLRHTSTIIYVDLEHFVPLKENNPVISNENSGSDFGSSKECTMSFPLFNRIRMNRWYQQTSHDIESSLYRLGNSTTFRKRSTTSQDGNSTFRLASRLQPFWTTNLTACHDIIFVSVYTDQHPSHVHFGVPGDGSNSHNPTQSDSRMIRMCQSFAEKAKLRYQIVKQICCICSSTYFDVSSWALNWPHKDKTKSCFSIFHAYKLTLALSWVQRSVWGRRGETRRQWHRRCHRHPETPRCSSDRWHPRCATQCLAGIANWKRWNQALG